MYVHTHNREGILKQIETKLTSGVEAGNDTFILIAATVYYHEQVGVAITSLLQHQIEVIE